MILKIVLVFEFVLNHYIYKFDKSLSQQLYTVIR